MSRALVKEQFLDGFKNRLADPISARQSFTKAFNTASEKLGTFELSTCACLAASAGSALINSDSERAEADLNACVLNLGGVLGDERVEQLTLICQLGLAAIQDIQGHGLTSNCFDLLPESLAANISGNLAKQFSCQLFKEKVIFDREIDDPAVSLLSSHLNSGNLKNAQLFESLLLIARNEYKTAQRLIEELIFQLEEDGSSKSELLLPSLLLGYCFALQGKPESSLTYTYWAADLAGDIYPPGSSEFIELQLAAAYAAYAYDTKENAEKYFGKITNALKWEAAPSEFMLAVYELQKLKGVENIFVGLTPELASALKEAHHSALQSNLSEGFNPQNSEPQVETELVTINHINTIKPRYDSDLNPRLLLIVDALQKRAAAENVFTVAETCL